MIASAVVGAAAFAVAVSAQSASIAAGTAPTTTGPSSNIAFTPFPPANVPYGQVQPLPYIAPAQSSPVNITLLTGCPNNCVYYTTLTSTETSGTFQWSVTQPSGCGYGLSINQTGVSDYSNNFCIVGGPSSISSSTTCTTSTTGYPTSPYAPVGTGAPVYPRPTGGYAPPTIPGVYTPPSIPYYTPGATPGSVPGSTGAGSAPGAMYTGAANRAQSPMGAGLMGLAGVAGFFAML